MGKRWINKELLGIFRYCAIQRIVMEARGKK